MAIISQSLTTLGLPARAAFLLLAAALWIIFAPIYYICSFVYVSIVLLPVLIAFSVTNGDVPEGDVASLATSHLLQQRVISGPWGVLRSMSGPVTVLGVIYVFVVYYGFLLTLVLCMPVYIALNWALRPLWRGFRDWSTVRAMLIERTRHMVHTVVGFVINLQYEYLQDEWRERPGQYRPLRHKLFVAVDYVREQAWLISLSRGLLIISRGLSHSVYGTVKNSMRAVLGSPHVPSLVKTPLSVFTVMTVLAEDGLRNQGVEIWDAIFSNPANKFASEVHNTEQERKRKQNQTIYEALSPPKDMIRILRILPGVEGQELQCFVHAEHRSTAKYEALSYVWGDPKLQRFIKLNGTRYAIGKNLYECLVHLRRATSERDLWVDTLCINQADADERSQQVVLMGDLYKKAERVVVWLGFGAKGVRELFCQASGHHETDSNDAEQAFQPLQPGQSDAIQHLLGSPWWSRVWTVQELILGSSTIVQYGNLSMSWESFCQMIDRSAGQMRPADLKRLGTFHAQYLALKYERQLYSQQVVRRFPLLERIYTFRGKQASLTVDKIFGFYGLLEDPSAEMLPQYGRHPNIIEEHFAIDFINRYKSLAVMAVAELTTIERSNGGTLRWEWFPCWSDDGCISSKTLFWTGLGAQAGGQPWSEDDFDAADGRLVRAEDEKVVLPFREEITLEGWHMDTVALASSEMTSEHVDGDRLETVLQQWLGVVCGPDGETDGRTRDSEKLRLFYKTITAGLFDDEQPPESPQHAKFSEAMQHACRCRRLFSTVSGRYGLGPRDTAPGDEIWVLLGMAVPVVLGRRDASNNFYSEDYRPDEIDDEEPFRYLGQAYIDELMRPGHNTTPVVALSEKDLEDVHIWSRGG